MVEDLMQKNAAEDWLQKLEEKMIKLLSRLEDSQKLIQRLTHEISSLKIERENLKIENTKREEELKKRLESLVSLFDTIEIHENVISSHVVMQPVLVQG